MLKYRILSCLILGATGVLLTVSCDQPPAVCSFAIGDVYATRLENLSVDCADDALKDELTKHNYETVGASAFYPIHPEMGVPDLTKGAAFAVQGGDLGTRRTLGELPLADPLRCTNAGIATAPEVQEGGPIYASGKFATDSAPDGMLCQANFTSDGSLTLKGIKYLDADPNGDPIDAATGKGIPKEKDPANQPPPVLCKEVSLPPTTQSYAWSEVKVLSNALYQGIAFQGTLTYTKDGCKATYKARGLYPEQTCHNYRTRRDATGAIVVDENKKPIVDFDDPPGSGRPIPPESTCYPGVDKGRVNPDVAVTCFSGDPAETPTMGKPFDGHCVLAKDLPSLR